MKRKKAALYDPYLDTLGGGERYALSIMKELQNFGYDIDIFWNQDISKAVEDRLQMKFASEVFKPNPHENGGLISSAMQLRQYDIFLYITDGSYVLSTAKKTYVYCMIPQKSLYEMDVISKLKTLNTVFITHSLFTHKCLKEWGIDAQVLYPYIDQEFRYMRSGSVKKDNIILSVGRFFPQLHSKRHDIAIKLFQKLKQNSNEWSSYKLILAGGLKPEDKDYYDEIKLMAGSDSSILLKPNVSFHELIDLYRKSEYYWHCAGWGIDEGKNPELVEHLGITPLEAMSSGCIPFVYANGGAKELIQDGITGFTFLTEQELIQKMNMLHSDRIKMDKMRDAGSDYIERTFSHTVFTDKLKSVFSISL